MRRSSTISQQDKQIVGAQLQTYDSLVDQDPYFREKIEQKVEQRALEAELRALQQMALEAAEDQYPSLKELAQEKVTLIRQPDVLRHLIKQIYKAPDEGTVHWLLNIFAG